MWDPLRVRHCGCRELGSLGFEPPGAGNCRERGSWRGEVWGYRGA